ncbi:MAG: hypothetical protein J6Y71_01555 [Ruminococcus sp.]|nr:hypothetical protein [Ruminococcus sp.]
MCSIRDRRYIITYSARFISFISFVLLEKNNGIKRSHALIAAAPTFLYGTVTMLLNILRIIEGPYPFLYVYQQPWFMSLFWYLSILGLSYIVALIAGKMVRKKNK